MRWEPEDTGAPVYVKALRTAAVILLILLTLGVLTLQPSCTHGPPSGKEIPPERLMSHVSMLSETLVPRSYEHVWNLDKCADYIARQFELAGGQVEMQKYEVKGLAYKNVIARFGPKSSSRIVVGAHYDAFRDTPGADDNASGVAGLIELAYLLGQANLRQEVELVGFTLEEPPYFRTENMGSARYTSRLQQDAVAVEAMLCLEMIGYFSDEKKSQRFPSALLRLYYPDQGNYITVVGSFGDRKLTRRIKASMKGATDLPVYSMTAPKDFPGLDFSDHLNFWNRDYKAVMITDTAFYRNTAYHGEYDTLQRLDFDRMAKVVLGVYEAVIDLTVSD